jgi:hypothetical protein
MHGLEFMLLYVVTHPLPPPPIYLHRYFKVHDGYGVTREMYNLHSGTGKAGEQAYCV